METVRDILEDKGYNIYSVKADTPVTAALKLMAEKNIGALLVLQGENKVEGIFSERDYARKAIAENLSCEDSAVGSMMTKKVYTVPLSTSVNDCMALMTTKRIRHLPVSGDGGVMGMISIGDVVKAVIHDQEILIDQLENYISGGY